MGDLEQSAAEQFALIRRVPLFSDLTDDEAADLWNSATRLEAAPGELIMAEGAPGDALYIILSGSLEVTKRDKGREISLATRGAGDFLGEMSLLQGAPRSASVRAVSPTQLLEIGPEAFRELLRRRPETAHTLLRTVISRLRSTEASLIQSDKLAALGTLAAGLAHELNNPAAAIQRSAALLGETFLAWRQSTAALGSLDLKPDERQGLAELELVVADCQSARRSDEAARAVEAGLVTSLETLGLEEPWEIGPAMACYGWTADRVQQLAGDFAPAHRKPVLQWLGIGLSAQQLMEEIRLASAAISDIVKAVKSYAYLDQAPVQEVDLEASINDTLTILNHKLKHGVEVVRDFEAGLPRVEAFAGELNQVWTNIIDNAIQAMQGKGRLEISGRRLGDQVELAITDSGPGIPPEVASRIYDPFFTTKEQGVGTGLGLHIANNIVVNRHRGRISLASEPGRTEFRIVLPRRFSAASSGN